MDNGRAEGWADGRTGERAGGRANNPHGRAKRSDTTWPMSIMSAKHLVVLSDGHMWLYLNSIDGIDNKFHG